MLKDGSWVQIENLKGVLALAKPTLIDPMEQSAYQHHWRQMRSRCVNGAWVEQFGKYRYVPGRILFFGNYCFYEEWEEETKSRIEGTPSVRDLEWHRFYYRMLQDGFSASKVLPLRRWKL